MEGEVFITVMSRVLARLTFRTGPS
jgi:hypothetical protein